LNPQDEKLRARVNDALTGANIDVRNLAIEVTDDHVSSKAPCPRPSSRSGLPACCTSASASADSAHESRHQLDSD
jgi:hypothetical protein